MKGATWLLIVAVAVLCICLAESRSSGGSNKGSKSGSAKSGSKSGSKKSGSHKSGSKSGSGSKKEKSDSGRSDKSVSKSEKSNKSEKSGSGSKKSEKSGSGSKKSEKSGSGSKKSKSHSKSEKSASVSEEQGTCYVETDQSLEGASSEEVITQMSAHTKIEASAFSSCQITSKYLVFTMVETRVQTLVWFIQTSKLVITVRGVSAQCTGATVIKPPDLVCSLCSHSSESTESPEEDTSESSSNSKSKSKSKSSEGSLLGSTEDSESSSNSDESTEESETQPPDFDDKKGDWGLALAIVCENWSAVNMQILILQLAQQSGIPVSAFSSVVISGNSFSAVVSKEYITQLVQFFASNSVTFSVGANSVTMQGLVMEGTVTVEISTSTSLTSLTTLTESYLIAELAAATGIDASYFGSVIVTETGLQVIVAEAYASELIEFYSSDSSSFTFESTTVTMESVSIVQSSTTSFTQSLSVDFYSLGVTEAEFIQQMTEMLGIPAEAVTEFSINADGSISCEIMDIYKYEMIEAFSNGGTSPIRITSSVDGSITEMTCTDVVDSTVTTSMTVSSTADLTSYTIETLSQTMSADLGIPESAFERIYFTESGEMVCVISNEYVSILQAAYVSGGEYSFEIEGTEVTLAGPPAFVVPDGALEITSGTSLNLLQEGFTLEQITAACAEAFGIAVENFLDIRINADGSMSCTVDESVAESVQAMLDASAEMTLTIDGKDVTITSYDPAEAKTVQVVAPFNLFDIGLERADIGAIMSEFFGVPESAVLSTIITENGFVCVIDEASIAEFQSSFESGPFEITVNGVTFDVGGFIVGEEIGTEQTLEPNVQWTGDFSYPDGLTEAEVTAASDYIIAELADLYGVEVENIVIEGSGEGSITEGTITVDIPADVINNIITNLDANTLQLKPCEACANFEITVPEGTTYGNEEFNFEIPGFGAMCFAGDGAVQTMNGTVMMKELKEGDQVLTVKTVAGRTTEAYEPIRWFIHRDHQTSSDFIRVDTQSGKTLKLSARHLLPIVSCDMNLGQTDYDDVMYEFSVFAERAQAGDCVISQKQGKSVLDRITKVSHEQSPGFYSPVTESGMVIVNGVHASCYSQLESHRWVRAGFRIMMWVVDMVGQVTGSGHKYSDALQAVDIPAIVSFFQKAASAM